MAQTQQYIAGRYGWCVDLDLEKFFDRVNHDKLVGQIAKRVEDKRLRKLIRAFLNAGAMENGLVRRTRLFFYEPFAHAVFLGQQLTSVGEIQLFEYQDLGYVPSCTLRT